MKKVVALSTAFSFIVWMNSCYSYNSLNTREQLDEYASYKRVYVTSVVTVQGDTMVFNISPPGRIIDSSVIGVPCTRINYGQVDSIVVKGKYGKISAFWNDGVYYTSFRRDSVGFLIEGKDTIVIPFPTVMQMGIKKFDNNNTLLLLALPISIGIILISAAIYELQNFELDMGI